jgi:hypothetical protein
MPVWLIRYTPHIAIVLALLGVVWWVADMRSDLRALHTETATLQAGLQAEQASHKRDVESLTVLTAGIAAAAVTTKHDNAILTETIDAKAPAASSPALANFMRCLAASDSNDDTSGCINGTAAAPAPGAVRK